MRILLVSTRGADLDFGGAERYVDVLRAGLTGAGHAVRVLAAAPARHDASPHRLTRHSSDPLQVAGRRIRDHLEAWVAPLPADLAGALAGVELVHTNNLPGIGTGIWELARRHSIPVVHTLHDYGLLCPRSSLRRRDGTPCEPHPLLCGLRTRRLARWAGGVDVVIGVSAHVLRAHAAVLSPRSATVVIPPPLLPVTALEPGPAPLGLRRLGYLGALTPEKGVPALLAAAPGLAARGVSLSLAGAGPLEPAVRAAPVHFVGHLRGAAVGRFLADHDAGVVSSTWEEPAVTFAALEWLAAGRPLLATRHGALAELAKRPGVLAYDGSAGGLLDAVDRCREDERWRTLTGALPPPIREDRERWLSDHLAAYARARGATRP